MSLVDIALEMIQSGSKDTFNVLEIYINGLYNNGWIDEKLVNDFQSQAVIIMGRQECQRK